MGISEVKYDRAVVIVEAVLELIEEEGYRLSELGVACSMLIDYLREEHGIEVKKVHVGHG